jgi:methylphosphotriester-DNA--protein-cysteine methyltransferase
LANFHNDTEPWLDNFRPCERPLLSVEDHVPSRLP